MAAVFTIVAREGEEWFLYITLEPDARRRDGDVGLVFDMPKGFCFRIETRAAHKLVKHLKTALARADKGLETRKPAWARNPREGRSKRQRR